MGAVATIVIPCRNAESTLPAALRGVDAQAGRADLTVIVCDNGSTDASVEIATQMADVVVTAERPGVAHARNAGLEEVQTPLMLSLDADCVPEPDWAREHLDALTAASPQTLGTAGRTVPYMPSDRWQRREDVTPHPAFDPGGHPLFAVAGNACYRTELLRRLGGFPPYGADDAALGFVARDADLGFAWCPGAVVAHRNPRGWRGYASQMVKVGIYSGEIDGPPDSFARWYLNQAGRLARTPAAIRRGAHEAVAQATKTVALSVGARRAWRRSASLAPAAVYAAQRASGG